MIFLLVPALVFALDFLVKSHVEKTRKLGEEERKLGGRVIIRRMSNYGTAGSKLKERPKLVCAMHGISMLVMTGAYIRLLMENGRTGLKLAVGLAIGGGASNLYDRIRKGYVTDYVSFRVPIKKIRKLVFNISDFMIMAGCILGILFGMEE